MQLKTDNPEVTRDTDDLDGADIIFVIHHLCDFWDIPPLTALFAIEDDTVDESDDASEIRAIQEIIEGTQSNYDVALATLIAYFALERDETNSIHDWDVFD